MMERLQAIDSEKDAQEAFIKTIKDLTHIRMTIDDEVLPLWMQIEKRAKARGKFNKRVQFECWLASQLDGTAVQIAVLGLVFLDIAAVFAELLLEATMCPDPMIGGAQF
jgi:hypothetical protein